jgi:hypothetical protein
VGVRVIFITGLCRQPGLAPGAIRLIAERAASRKREHQTVGPASGSLVGFGYGFVPWWPDWMAVGLVAPFDRLAKILSLVAILAATPGVVRLARKRFLRRRAHPSERGHTWSRAAPIAGCGIPVTRGLLAAWLRCLSRFAMGVSSGRL